MKKPLFACPTLLPLFILLVFFASGSEAGTGYKVKKGDSFYTIAKKYHISINELKNANTASAKDIKPGDRVIIPSQKKEAPRKIKSIDHDNGSVSYKKTIKDNSSAGTSKQTSTAAPMDLYHLVKKGDTLVSISRKYSVSVSELKELNSLNKSAKLKNGQRLLVKSAGPEMYTVRKGDTIWNIAKKFNLEAAFLFRLAQRCLLGIFVQFDMAAQRQPALQIAMVNQQNLALMDDEDRHGEIYLFIRQVICKAAIDIF